MADRNSARTEDPFFEWSLAGRRLEKLRNLARRVFVDRNAAGMTPAHRPVIKALARPHMRIAIGLIRKARRAALAGDDQEFDLLDAKICAKLNQVQVQFSQPAREQLAKSIGTLAKARGNERPKDPIRERLMQLMAGKRREGIKFREFLTGWQTDEELKGLRIGPMQTGETREKDYFLVTLEASYDDPTEESSKRYTRGSLGKMYSQASARE